MATEPPALPVTDDPFELLGVVPPTTELELRRAYVRRSKQFRPERAPEAFMRIRRAYEQALSRLRWSIYDTGSDADDADAEGGPLPAADQADGPVAAGPADVADAAADVAEDAAERVEDAASSGAPRAPGAPGAIDAAPGTSAGLAIESADDLVAAIADRRAVPADVLERLPADELDRVARDRRIDWSVLRAQPDRWLGLELLRLRLQRLVMDGEVGQVLDLIGSDAVRGDLLSVPPLEGVVARALVGCAWSADPRADALFALLDGQGGGREANEVLGLYAEARSLAAAWAAIPEVRACPPLRRFVERFAAVSHQQRRELVNDVRDALDRRPLDVVAALDAMGRADARFLFHVHIVTEETVYGDDLAYEDLAPREQEYIAHAMKAIERMTGPKNRPDGPWFLIVAFAAVGIGKFAVGGAWGTVLGVTLLMIAAIPTMIRHWARTAREVRTRLVDAVITTGLRPDRMLEWHGPGDEKRPDLFGADTGLADDLVLHTLARLARLARQWAA